MLFFVLILIKIDKMFVNIYLYFYKFLWCVLGSVRYWFCFYVVCNLVVEMRYVCVRWKFII